MSPKQPPHTAEADAVLGRQLPRGCSLPVPGDELLGRRGRQQAPPIVVSLIDELATVSHLSFTTAAAEPQSRLNWCSGAGDVEQIIKF
jgi:hypothetical protein